jgi:hypothetical protein
MKVAAAVALGLVLSFTSCTSQYQRRGTEISPLPAITVDQLEGDSVETRLRQLDWESRSVERFANFDLGVVEIDDDGFTNPAQLRQVMDMVDGRAKESGRGMLIVTFVHGWHHGAGVCDRDLCCFRRVLDRLSRMDHLAGKVNVVGVFIGWRGESIAKRYVNATTLWNRKSAAQHIGRTGAKEVLLGLDEEYRTIKEKQPDKYVAMVTVGHSLGGAMVFNVMKGLATGNVARDLGSNQHSLRVIRAEKDRVAAAAKGEKAIRARLGDLVVLVNPAIEASQYAPFDNDLPDTSYPHFPLPDKNLRYSDEQLPVLMTVASEADMAVGLAFPAARVLSGVIHPSILESSAKILGMGHYKPQITHSLDYTGDEVKDVAKVQCGCSMNFGSAALNGTEELDLYGSGKQELGGLKFTLLRDAAKWDRHSPFLVVKASSKVIDSHSDIYNPVFVSFLQKYIQAYVKESASMMRK